MVIRFIICVSKITTKKVKCTIPEYLVCYDYDKKVISEGIKYVLL